MNKESKSIALIITLITIAIFVSAAIYPDSETHFKFIQKFFALTGVTLIIASIYAVMKSLNDTNKSVQILEKIEINQKKMIFMLQKNIENKQH